MKIITWNCNLNLIKKFEHIEKLRPDIVILQECEKLDQNYFPNSKYFWIGKNEKKGLGVLVFNSSAKIDQGFNQNLIYFLPINTDTINILGAWAYNHRASQRFGIEYQGNTSSALDYYETYLSYNDKVIFSGDLNNSVIWDKGNKENNFKNINSKLVSLNFKSVYHLTSKENFGKETKGTLFHTKNENKPYHIDYIYFKGVKLKNFNIGNYKDWIKYSDHVPLIASFET